ncbi:hypothetical protein HJC10_00240 [Corallococcus exiguus]|uniref:hypothetical protein n=1 Tax=Corallococcus TaxID=83461 RepID=UPI00147230E4|nr:hypothetical protein [Corallococcus exiguus]NNB92475.1 hypothetical protein [Corallococcus exiguus]NNC01293.1 hypothetical protein [Corallococcus exiguus]
MTVSLTNTSGRCLVFVLAHETYCKALDECRCDVEQGRRARRTARSLTLASGVTSPALDDAVLAIPDVVRAVKRGVLAVKRHVTELPKPAVAATPTPTTTSPAEVSRPDVKAKKNKRGAS